MTLRSTNSATADGYRKGGTRQTREACSIPRYRYDDVRTGSGDVTNKVLTRRMAVSGAAREGHIGRALLIPSGFAR